MVDLVEAVSVGKEPDLFLGTMEDVVHPPHPDFPEERVRVGLIEQSDTWVLMVQANRASKNYRHLRRCSDEHITDLQILDSMGMIDRDTDCNAPVGSYVIRSVQVEE